MSESTSSASSHGSHSYDTPDLLEPQNALVRLGGAMGIAGASLGLLVFFVACAGFDAAFVGFPILPLILGSIGLLLSLAGVLKPHPAKVNDTAVLAAFFVNSIAVIGALLEIAIWQKWAIFSMANG